MTGNLLLPRSVASYLFITVNSLWEWFKVWPETDMTCRDTTRSHLCLAPRTPHLSFDLPRVNFPIAKVSCAMGHHWHWSISFVYYILEKIVVVFSNGPKCVFASSSLGERVRRGKLPISCATLKGLNSCVLFARFLWGRIQEVAEGWHREQAYIKPIFLCDKSESSSVIGVLGGSFTGGLFMAKELLLI